MQFVGKPATGRKLPLQDVAHQVGASTRTSSAGTICASTRCSLAGHSAPFSADKGFGQSHRISVWLATM